MPNVWRVSGVVCLHIACDARDQQVTHHDLRILQRAEQLLQEPSQWNRNDDRECGDDEAQNRRSLFCALHKASIDVLGSYQHRRTALQEVRCAVEEATRGRAFEHRLRDFNNLPETQLADVQRVITTAAERVGARLPEPL